MNFSFGKGFFHQLNPTTAIDHTLGVNEAIIQIPLIMKYTTAATLTANHPYVIFNEVRKVAFEPGILKSTKNNTRPIDIEKRERQIGSLPQEVIFQSKIDKGIIER
jgi:hypothetical protein